MNNSIEIELRYKILDLKQLQNFLLRAKQLHIKHDVDVYFDMPDRLLWKRGIFIRIRNDKKLDIKFNRACLHDLTIDRLDYCEEHSFALPLQETDLQKLNRILTSLDLQPIAHADLLLLKSANNIDMHYIVDKERTSYEYHGFTIAVDKVAGLGHFLEIELMAQDADNLEHVKHDMQCALAGLPLQPIHIGYGALLLKQNEYGCYVQGRYALQADKK